jgi:hypothetical protein
MTTSHFDPEAHAHRLAPAGAILSVFGSCLGGPLGIIVALLGLLLLILSTYSHTDGLLLLGPFAKYELARAARVRRPWLWRSVYGVAAGLILIGNIDVQAPGMLHLVPTWYPPGTLARINEHVTLWFGAVLAGYCIISTLQIMPSIVSEERETKRWDILLTTDLRPREILLGKIIGRLVIIAEPLLTILPILALMPLWGGVPPEVIGLYAIILGLSILSITAMACFYSVFSATTKEASGRVTALTILYVMLGGASSTVPLFPILGTFPASIGVDIGVTFADVFAWAMIGNPLAIVLESASQMRGGRGAFVDLLIDKMGPFIAFHIAFICLFGLLACKRLRFAKPWTVTGTKHSRQVARAERSTEPTPEKPVLAKEVAERPPVPDNSVTWWERYGHMKPKVMQNHMKLNWKSFARTFLYWFVIIVGLRILDPYSPYLRGMLTTTLQSLVPGILFFAILGMVLSPLFKATACIAKERNADTLESLWLTDLSSREILWQKWYAVVIEPWPVACFCLAIALAGICSGVLFALVLPALILTVPSVMALGASWGLLFSVRAKTPAIAGRNIVLVSFGGLGIIGVVVSFITNFFNLDLPPMMLATFVPMVSVFLSASMEALAKENPSQIPLTVCFCILGILLQFALAYGLFRLAEYRFEKGRAS